MGNIQFISFDVETASIRKPRFICQIGFTVVNNNNEIVESKSFYIQPPNNEIDSKLSMIHGVTPDKTLEAKNFLETWDSIKDLFLHKIVAHNASFDLSVLLENLEYYNLDSSFIDHCECTYRIFNRRLDELCHGFGIDYTDHHHAGFDAECCAKFYINYLKGIEPDESLMDSMHPKERKSRKAIYGEEDRLKGDILQKDLSNADPSNPFYDKKIVITGSFCCDRKDLAKKLKEMGADINTSISKLTDIALVGDKPGSSKMSKIKSLQNDGFPIRIIEEDELDRILGKY
jgi:DNA polymerase-3 subunit epsilon